MHSTFSFNGHSSDEFGIYIENRNNLNRSARKFQSASVAGRNGNIYQLESAWEEVIVSYEVFAGGREKGEEVTSFKEIMEWLNSADDYAVLTDTYDEDHYRMAVFVDATEIEPQWLGLGRATITFRCRPERYLIGQEKDYPSGIGTVGVGNQTNHDANPLIRLYGSGQRSMLNLNNRSAVAPSHGGYTSNNISPLISSQNNGYSAIKRTGNREIQVGGTSQLTVGSITNTNGVIDFTVTSAAQSEEWGVGIVQSVQGDADYTISCEAYNGGHLQVMCASGSGYNELLQTFTTTSSGSGWKSTSFSFHTPSDCGYILILFSRQSSHSTTLQRYRKIMLNKGNTAKTFKEYDASASSTVLFSFPYTNMLSKQMTILGSYDIAEIDCERENVSLDGVNSNQFVTLTDSKGNISAEYLYLPKKTSTDITPSGEAVGIYIDPRLWEL